MIIHVGALSLLESQELVCILRFLSTMCVINIKADVPSGIYDSFFCRPDMQQP